MSSIESPNGQPIRRVLCIDDDPGIIRTIRRVLSLVSIEVVGASTGEAALDLVADPRERFDLVLVDLNMPGLGGFEVLGRMLGIRQDLPVVVMSGAAGDWPTVARELGAVATLCKPFSAESLMAIVAGKGGW
jgi:two-component system phosphate regulon response regulator PhoB